MRTIEPKLHMGSGKVFGYLSAHIKATDTRDAIVSSDLCVIIGYPLLKNFKIYCLLVKISLTSKLIKFFVLEKLLRSHFSASLIRKQGT